VNEGVTLVWIQLYQFNKRMKIIQSPCLGTSVIAYLKYAVWRYKPYHICDM